MIQVDGNNGVTGVSAWSEPPLIYMDNWALSDFSTDASLRQRFLKLFKDRGTLAVSVMNAVEIASHHGEERPELRSFLGEIGPHWFPLTTSSDKVMEAQETDHDTQSGCFSEAFLSDPHFLSRLHTGNLTLVHLVDLTRGADGSALETADRSSEIAKALSSIRSKYAVDPKVLDTYWPALPFSSQAPMRPIYNAFMRLCVKQSFNLTKVNHLRDLQHAIASVACAEMTLLDKHWTKQAREVQKQLKMPSDFVKIYWRAEVEQFLADVAGYPPSRGLHDPPA